MQAHMARALGAVSLLAAAQPQGPRITLTALLVRVCAVALLEHPAVNASFQEETIAEWADANIGVAVAVDDGLVVPVIHGAQGLPLAQVAARLEEVTAKARAGTLAPGDVQDGTFTISNLGMLGVDGFTAIVNPPQAAILAVGRVAHQTWVTEEGGIEVAPLMQMTLTADHRVLDGALAARFLATVKRYLEQPLFLI
jgi:pyruvate dehydrogenase E2 component (dihydrolipoamide acetyltransferase)